MYEAIETTKDLAGFDLDLVEEINNDPVESSTIKKIVGGYLGITNQEMECKSRKREFVTARQLSMFFIKFYTDFSLTQIGNSFGGRDHSTVIHAISTVKDLNDTDKAYKEQFETLKNLIKHRPKN